MNSIQKVCHVFFHIPSKYFPVDSNVADDERGKINLAFLFYIFYSVLQFFVLQNPQEPDLQEVFLATHPQNQSINQNVNCSFCLPGNEPPEPPLSVLFPPHWKSLQALPPRY